MIEQNRADEQQRKIDGRPSPAATSSASQEQGYWAYMQRQMNERTQKLGIVGDSMDRLEENSSGWAEDVSKFVSNQKRKAVMGGEFLCFRVSIQSTRHYTDSRSR